MLQTIEFICSQFKGAHRLEGTRERRSINDRTKLTLKSAKQSPRTDPKDGGSGLLVHLHGSILAQPRWNNGSTNEALIAKYAVVEDIMC